MNLRNLPYPELVRKGTKPFTVIPVDRQRPYGATNLTAREMFVPTADKHQGVRRHEMGHAAWSPKTVYSVAGIDPGLLIMLEEARVNLGSGRVSLPIREPLDAETATVIGMMAERAHDGHAAGWSGEGQSRTGSNGKRVDMGKVFAALAFRGIVSTTEAGEEIDLRDAFGPQARAIADFAEQELLSMAGGRPVCSPEQLVELGKRIQEMFPQLPWNPSGQGGKALAGLGDAKGTHSCAIGALSGRDPHGTPDPDGDTTGVGAGLADYAKTMRELAGKFDDLGEMDAMGPGDLTIKQPPLAVPIKDLLGAAGRRPRSTEEGVVVRSPSRWAIDGAVFGRKRKRTTGGTVLVDWSGSMSWTESATAELLAQAPGTTTVALYNGGGSEGQLVVIARNGRRMDGLPERQYGGNVVDAPALGWLATQQEPRIWVTDFGVSGRHDRGSTAMGLYCLRIVERAGIHVSRNWQPVKDMLAGKTSRIPADQEPPHMHQLRMNKRSRRAETKAKASLSEPPF